MSRATWQLSATFANSQSLKKREILSPGPRNPTTSNASLHMLLLQDAVEDALWSSDQASPSLSHIGLFGQSIFPFFTQLGDLKSITVSSFFRHDVQGQERTLLSDIRIDDRAEGLTVQRNRQLFLNQEERARHAARSSLGRSNAWKLCVDAHCPTRPIKAKRPPRWAFPQTSEEANSSHWRKHLPKVLGPKPLMEMEMESHGGHSVITGDYRLRGKKIYPSLRSMDL